MTKRYTISAGCNSTDLGVVGRSDTLLGAKRIGRHAVLHMLPDGQGIYRVRDGEGREVLAGELSIRTGFRWMGL